MTLSTNATSTAVRVMQWPARTCYPWCAHGECQRRRREIDIPCFVCGAKILRGQFYRPTAWVDGEVVSQLHHGCERRSIDR